MLTSVPTAGSDAGGIALAGSSGRWWAWYGVQVTATTDLSQLAEVRRGDRETLLRNAFDADRAYLAGQLGSDSAIELRWSSQPDEHSVRLDVLGQLMAESAEEARRRALLARARLLAVPRHVVARELASDQELDAALRPLSHPPAGMAELRKRWIVERRQREDSPWPYYVSSPWLREVPDAAWAALVRALAASPQRVVLSIGLSPQQVPDQLSVTISQHAAAYRRLTEPGISQPTGLFRDPVPFAADPGAMTAGLIFEDAGQRYQDRVFKLRIALASEAPLAPDLVTLVREVMSPAETGDARGFRSAALTGAALTVVTPQSTTEIDAFRSNFEGLGHVSWGQPAVPRPDVLPYIAAVRELGDIVDVREATAVFRFPVALDGTYEGFPVVRPRDNVRVEIDRRPSNDIVLGDQGQGTARQSVTVPLSSLTSHTLVVGSTGSGKTSTVLNLLEQVWGTHRTPFLVIEPVNADRDDYRWLLERPGFEQMTVFTIGDESLAPFRLNPFEVPAGVRIGTHLASLVACFDAAFGLTGPLPFLYRKAIREVYTRIGISPDELSGPRHIGRWPRLRDLADVFATLPDIDRYAGEVRSNISAASRLRAESLLTGSCGRTLDAVSSYPIEDLLDRPVVLELAAVGDDDREQALVIALLLNSLTAYYKATRTTGALAHLTVIEEAHRLLRRPQPTGADEGGGQSARAAEQFANTLAENRKYGEGLVIVEQVPSKLIEDAHKNTALKIMHHLPAADDRGAIAATMNLSEDQQTQAQALPTMTAYVTHRGMGGRAGLIDVPDIRGDVARKKGITEDPLPGNDVVRQRFESFVRTRPRVWDDLAPFAECGDCASRCQFRGISEVAAPVSVDLVRTRLKATAYPEDEAGRDQLFNDLSAHYETSAREYGDYTGQQVRDLGACLFMHATFAAFPGKRVHKLVQRYRAATPNEARRPRP